MPGWARPLCTGGGERADFAPAYDQGALNPGCMPLFVALIAAIVLGEKLSATRKWRFALILAGALIIIGWHAAARSAVSGPSRTFGDALFLFAAFLSACFTVLIGQGNSIHCTRQHLSRLNRWRSIYLSTSHCTEPASLRYRSARLRFKRYSRAFS